MKKIKMHIKDVKSVVLVSLSSHNNLSIVNSINIIIYDKFKILRIARMFTIHFIVC